MSVLDINEFPKSKSKPLVYQKYSAKNLQYFDLRQLAVNVKF
jgi:hypothetical protein